VYIWKKHEIRINLLPWREPERAPTLGSQARTKPPVCMKRLGMKQRVS